MIDSNVFIAERSKKLIEIIPIDTCQQVSLFRTFQQVFDAPKDARYEEIRRLGVYVIRQFVEMAPKNPKIFAELFFYKTVREANDIENGYDEHFDDG